MMNKIEHIHTWIPWRIRIGKLVKPKLHEGEPVFKCISTPDCSSFKPMSLLLGKESLCPGCFTKFILTRLNMRMAVPKCEGCRNTKKGKIIREARGIMDRLLDENSKEEQRVESFD